MPVKIYKFTLFHLADELWALPLLPTSQFIACEAITLIPGAPENVLGLVYHGGKIITLLDTAKILDLRVKRIRSKNCLLFDYQGDYYGLEVDDGDNTIRVKQVFTDRSKKKFNKYIKVNKRKVYIFVLFMGGRLPG